TLPASPGGIGTAVLPYPPFLAETVIDTGAPDNYGSLIEGYLTAPETGAYTFWLASDDEAQFYLNTDASDSLNPAKTNLICWVSGWSGSREWSKFPEQQSAPVTLQQGKTYFLRILHKEGTGGDHIVLGWQTPSGVLERPMPAWHFQPVRDTRWFENDVEIVLGPVLPKTPGDTSLYDGMLTVAYVNINLPQPVTYQWLKGTTPIANATNAYYLFRVNSADSFTEYSVRVNSGGTVYPAGPAQVPFVIPDKPSLVSAGPVPQNPTRLQVVFSEEVNPLTATNPASYTLTITNSNTTIPVQGATLAADGRTVTLATALLPVNGVYRLDVSNVQDMAAPANTMDPASTYFVLADGSISFRVYNAAYATDLPTLRTWSNTNSTTASYLWESFDDLRLITTNSYPWNLTPPRDNYTAQLIGYLTAPESGNYKFAMASDDHSILYLGTNDLRASKREICNYNGSTARWTLNAQSNQRSGDVYLEAGKRYYFEAVYRDGTGGDGITVAWQTPSMVASGQTLPTSNPGVQSETEPFIIPAQYVSPFSAYGNVFFRTNLAATVSAAESTRPVLRVTADGTLPYSYQWYKVAGGVTNPIAGATTPTYTLPFLRPADNGSSYFVVVTNNF
ncbi:MAG TPA: PA14 domain-containing protein, partial [Bacillota bacterium]|nr:PA14 domain-containing protein [Bacillota bacterium]